MKPFSQCLLQNYSLIDYRLHCCVLSAGTCTVPRHHYITYCCCLAPGSPCARTLSLMNMVVGQERLQHKGLCVTFHTEKKKKQFHTLANLKL